MNERRAYIKQSRDRLYQGDIYSDVELVVDSIENGPELTVEKRKLPYAVVITQDCDLEQDFKARNNTQGNQDKWLPSIILFPAYPAETLKLGLHLGDYDQKMEQFDSKRFGQIKQNSNSRYHFIHSDNTLNVPELIIDFKHYHTITRNAAYSRMLSGSYVATIGELFREHLSARLCYYLSRIGLPNTVEE